MPLARRRGLDRRPRFCSRLKTGMVGASGLSASCSDVEVLTLASAAGFGWVVGG